MTKKVMEKILQSIPSAQWTRPIITTRTLKLQKKLKESELKIFRFLHFLVSRCYPTNNGDSLFLIYCSLTFPPSCLIRKIFHCHTNFFHLLFNFRFNVFFFYLQPLKHICFLNLPCISPYLLPILLH